MRGSCVVWLNGSFGAGKTSVARILTSELPGALMLDPEDIGRWLRKVVPADLRRSDFQDIPTWRRLTVATIEGLLRDYSRPVIVPMTVVDPVYFGETVGRLRDAGIDVYHFCLVASPETIRRRLIFRCSAPWATWWTLRQVQRCTVAVRSPEFAVHVDTENRSVREVVSAIWRLLPVTSDENSSTDGSVKTSQRTSSHNRNR